MPNACSHNHESICDISSTLAGMPVSVNPKACEYCLTKDPKPASVNYVTVSLAVAHVTKTGRRDLRKQILADHRHLIHSGPSRKSAAAFSPEIPGPGTELKRIFSVAGFTSGSSCSCESLIRLMNALGPSGCREQKEVLALAVRDSAKLHSLAAKLLVTVTPTLALEVLIEKAIRQYERKMPVK